MMTLAEMGVELERLVDRIAVDASISRVRRMELLSEAILALCELRRNAVSDEIRRELGGKVVVAPLAPLQQAMNEAGCAALVPDHAPALTGNLCTPRPQCPDCHAALPMVGETCEYCRLSALQGEPDPSPGMILDEEE